jgi:hypothetical protein
MSFSQKLPSSRTIIVVFYITSSSSIVLVLMRSIRLIVSCVFCTKVRSPIPWVYGGFYTVYYKDIGEFQILYLQDICW